MTAPTSLPPSCSLWVDGARYADGSTPGETDDMPVALSDLQVTWGRDNSLDQPGPATCTFTVMDAPGGPSYSDSLYVGARVAVRADAVIYPDPTIPIVVDASFEAAPVGSTPSSIRSGTAAVTVTTRRARTGTRSVFVNPAGTARARVIFPPAPFSAAHDPAAWDAVPRTLAGSRWSYGAAVWLPTALGVHAAAVVRPVLFTKPWAAGYTVSTAAATPGVVDGAGWRPDTGTFLPPADRWVGVCVDIYPTGDQWNQVSAGITWDSLPASLTWDDLCVYVDDLVVLAPAAGAARSGAVFSGRVTDLSAAWDLTIGATLVQVIAADDTAELGNRYAGRASAWAAEPLGTRAGRILTAAAQPGLTATVDPTITGKAISYRPAGEATALSLLQELTQSVGGVLWSAASLVTGPYLLLEDVNARPALLTLERGPDLVIRIVPSTKMTTGGVTLSACDVLLEPTTWVQDTSDTATRVTVSWLEQTVSGPDVVLVDQAVTVVDTVAEKRSGRLEVTTATQLTTAPDAQVVADALMARLAAEGWRIGGLTWRAEANEPLTPAQIAAVMTILDGTTRLGLPLMLTDLPDWSPIPAETSVPLYLEGSFLTNTRGAWELEMVVSSAAGTGGGRYRWDDLPSGWQWDQFDPAISWNDLRGVGI